MSNYNHLKTGFYWARRQAIDPDGFYNEYMTEENAWCIVEIIGVSPFLRGEIIYAGEGIQPPTNTIADPSQWEWSERIPMPRTLKRKRNLSYEAKRFLVRN